jgi:hypothetical protein
MFMVDSERSSKVSIKRITGVFATRWRGLVAAALGALLLAACSSFKLGYNNADTLLLYTLDSYFDLSDEQSQLARAQLAKFLDWHRSTQLPGYAQLLNEAKRKIDQGQVAPDQLLAFYGRMTAELQRLGDKAAPELAALALTLTPTQIDRFAQKLDKDTVKARRELVRFAGNESLEERIKRNTERAQSWFGSLSGAQEELIRRTLQARPDNAAWWIGERERRQRTLVAVLRRIEAEKPDAATATVWLRSYFAQLALPEGPEQRARTLEFRRGNAELIAALLNSASAEQKAHLLKKLRGYADDFGALAAAGQRG